MSYKVVNLNGGLDLSTNVLKRQPSTAKEALNFFESASGGYTNVRGYERYDGQPLPSLATYFFAEFEKWDLGSAVKNNSTLTLDGKSYTVLTHTVDALTQTATAVLYGEELPTLSLPLTVAGGKEMVLFEERGAPDDVQDSLNILRAADFRRNKIAKVTGAGPIRGVAQVDGIELAWRDTLAVDTCFAYKSTPSGWEKVRYASLVSAPKGVDVYAGDLLNGGDYRVLTVYPYLDDTGTRINEKNVYSLLIEKDTAPALSLTTVLTPDKADSTIGQVEELIPFAFKPSGKVETALHNFYAGDSTRHLFITDGVNCAAVYKPAYNVIQPIASNMRKLDDVHTHVIAHNSRLWLATNKGTLVTSVTGEPEQLDGFLGAAEWGAGDVITGMAETNAASLYVFTKHTTLVIKGKGLADWTQDTVSTYTGAVPNGNVALDDVYTFSSRGISSLARTQTNGGFSASTVSDRVQPLVDSLNPNELTAAILYKKEGQLRFYFRNRFLMLTRVMHNVNGKEGVRLGITEGLYNVALNCVDAAENSSGGSKIIAGGEDGYVYVLESGSSADGLPMEYNLSLNNNHLNDPQRLKRFRKLTLMSTAEAATEITFSQSNSGGLKSYSSKTIKLLGGGSLFDAGQWDKAVFDANPEARKKLTLLGSGYNVELSFYLESATAPRFTLHGYTIHYTVRGLAK